MAHPVSPIVFIPCALARKKNETTVEIQKCGEKFYSDQDTVERLRLFDYWCPLNNTYSIAGTYHSPHFRYIELKFYK